MENNPRKFFLLAFLNVFFDAKDRLALLQTFNKKNTHEAGEATTITVSFHSTHRSTSSRKPHPASVRDYLETSARLLEVRKRHRIVRGGRDCAWNCPSSHWIVRERFHVFFSGFIERNCPGFHSSILASNPVHQITFHRENLPMFAG